jgi:hypothetical protein
MDKLQRHAALVTLCGAPMPRRAAPQSHLWWDDLLNITCLKYFRTLFTYLSVQCIFTTHELQGGKVLVLHIIYQLLKTGILSQVSWMFP